MGVMKHCDLSELCSNDLTVYTAFLTCDTVSGCPSSVFSKNDFEIIFKDATVIIRREPPPLRQKYHRRSSRIIEFQAVALRLQCFCVTETEMQQYHS